MSAVFGPACRCLENLRVLDRHVRALFDQKLNHCAAAVKCCVMQPGSGGIKASGNRVDLGVSFRDALRSSDVTVHARVDKRIVDDAVAVLCKGGVLRCQHVSTGSIEVREFDDFYVAPRPVDGTRFWSETAVV